jgi:chromosome segregation ATPase
MDEPSSPSVGSVSINLDIEDPYDVDIESLRMKSPPKIFIDKETHERRFEKQSLLDELLEQRKRSAAELFVMKTKILELESELKYRDFQLKNAFDEQQRCEGKFRQQDKEIKLLRDRATLAETQSDALRETAESEDLMYSLQLKLEEAERTISDLRLESEKNRQFSKNPSMKALLGAITDREAELSKTLAKLSEKDSKIEALHAELFKIKAKNAEIQTDMIELLRKRETVKQLT